MDHWCVTCNVIHGSLLCYLWCDLWIFTVLVVMQLMDLYCVTNYVIHGFSHYVITLVCLFVLQEFGYHGNCDSCAGQESWTPDPSFPVPCEGQRGSWDRVQGLQCPGKWFHNIPDHYVGLQFVIIKGACWMTKLILVNRQQSN